MLFAKLIVVALDKKLDVAALTGLSEEAIQLAVNAANQLENAKEEALANPVPAAPPDTSKMN